MQSIAEQKQKSLNTDLKERHDFEAKNRRRMERKQLFDEKRLKSTRLMEQFITALVIAGLLTLNVVSLLNDGLFIKELATASLIIGGVLLIRAFGQSTTLKA